MPAPKNVPVPTPVRVPITPYRSPAINPTYLHENGIVFVMRDASFETLYDRNGVRQDWLHAKLYTPEGEEIGMLRTTAQIVVSMMRDITDNLAAQGVPYTEIGPLRMSRGERAFYLEDWTDDDVPF